MKRMHAKVGLSRKEWMLCKGSDGDGSSACVRELQQGSHNLLPVNMSGLRTTHKTQKRSDCLDKPHWPCSLFIR